MRKTKLTILVEGRVDSLVVRHFLVAADLDADVRIDVCGGKSAISKRIATLNSNELGKFIALIDADELSIADSRQLAREQLSNPSIPVFCAVPTIEAWLFADNVLAEEVARTPAAESILERTPLPELIPYPKQLANNVFPKDDSENTYNFLSRVNISRAASRSPSLRVFLSGVAEALGKESVITTTSFGSSIGRDAFSTLLRELPGDSIAWKTMSGSVFKADELAKEIAEGTEVGMQYITEVLRIARDIVARKSRT